MNRLRPWQIEFAIELSLGINVKEAYSKARNKYGYKVGKSLSHAYKAKELYQVKDLIIKLREAFREKAPEIVLTQILDKR